MFFQYDRLGRVASYSEKRIKTDKFLQIKINLTDEEKEKLKMNYDLFIENKNLVFKPNSRIIKQEIKDQLIEKSKNNVSDAYEIINLISQII